MFDVEACSMVGAVRRVTARLLFLHCQADPGGITVSGSGISRYSRPPRREYDENGQIPSSPSSYPPKKCIRNAEPLWQLPCDSWEPSLAVQLDSPIPRF